MQLLFLTHAAAADAQPSNKPTFFPAPTMMAGRVEVGLMAGMIKKEFSIFGDPVLNRAIISAIASYHFSEIFGVEFNISYAPFFKRGLIYPAYTEFTYLFIGPMTDIAPDITQQIVSSDIYFIFSPIYGEFTLFKKHFTFDIFGNMGTGMVNTMESLESLRVDMSDTVAISTFHEWHPTTVLGTGTRLCLNHTLTLRLSVSWSKYIETINATNLEMKAPVSLQFGMTFFL